MVDDIGGATAINDTGVVAGQFGVTGQGNQGVARVFETTIEKMPIAGGGTPFAINSTGTMVGSGGPDPIHAIRVDGTTISTIPGLDGSAGDVAYDINDAGLVVGTSFLTNGESRSWTNDGTDTVELPSFGGDYENATKINNAGLIAGSARDSNGAMHLVTWVDGVVADVGGAAFSSANATDMNEAGHVLGSVTSPPNTNRAILWDGSTALDLGTLPGGNWTSAGALNETGGVVVSAQNAAGDFHAARWDGTGLVDLGTLPGGLQSFASGINEHDQIVGTSFVDATRTHGFLIDDGVMYDLNELVPPDSVEIENAQAISDSGHILAFGRNGQAIVLVPGTRPAADYDVVDLSDGLPGQHFDASPTDMNDARQATGSVSSRAFRHDGTTSSFIFPGFTESFGQAISPTGVVVGNAENGGDFEAFRYDGAVQFLGTLGGPASAASDINGAGYIVGAADAANGQRHAFVYRDGSMVDLHTLGGTQSQAQRINEAGTIIGSYSPTPSTFRAFVSDGTTTTDLGTLGSGATSAFDLNDSDVIVGASGGQAFRYANGTMTSIAPPGSTTSDAIAISEGGLIAGGYNGGSGVRRTYLLQDGGHTFIPDLGGAFATVTDVNDAGQVVGYASTASGSTRATLFDGGELVDLSAHLPIGYESIVQVAFRINEEGTILARGVRADFRETALLLVPTGAPSTPPLTIDTSRPAASSVARYGRVEKEFTLNRSYGPDEIHDPAVIDVTATFRAPSGASYTVPAFFGTDYTLRPGTGIGGSELYDPVPGTESGVWHARFSPDETGTWRYTLRAQDKRPGQSATKVSAQMTFSVTASAAKGQVERDPRDSRFLRYTDGTPYLPMGQNVAFGDRNPFNDGSHYYEPHLESMQAAGQNWTRVWMTDFYITAIEWNATHFSGQYDGVGRYADIPAFRVEQILDLAEQYGLEVQLVLNDHGQFSSHVNPRWHDNPYNEANGGPVPEDDPAAFFSDPTARGLFKQRLRYLVARYGAYRDILAWELFNETQFIGTSSKNPFGSQQVRDDLVAWHAEMAAYLRSLDPYDHLITTSSDIDTSAAAIWDDPNIDLVQVHDYGALAGRDQRFRGYATNLNATYGKPVIIGEFGLSGDPEPEFDPTTSGLPADRIAHLVQGTALHNSAWASSMSASGAMSWWWGNYIRDNASQHRDPPAFPLNERINPPLRDFFEGEDPAGMGLDVSAITAPASVVALGLDNASEGFAWIRDAQNEYGSGVGPGDAAGRTMTGVSITLAGFAAGTYRIEVHDPWGVAATTTQTATASGGSLAVTLPSFTRDLAIKIEPSPETIPAAPTDVTATKGNAQATVAWTPPDDGGSPILSYTVTSSPGGITATAGGSATSATVTGLTNGTAYTFTVTATNAVGTGPSSAPSNAVTPAAPAPQSITFPRPPNATLAQSPLSVTATASSGLPVTLTSTTPSVCTASGLSIDLHTAGTCTMTATQPGNADFLPASPVTRSFTVAQATQTITFPKPPNSTMLQSPLTISATASSGLPVTVASTTPAVCTIDGVTVTLVGPGTCTLRATQPGNAVYAAATPVVRSFSVTKVAQTITFPRPPTSTLIQSPLTLSPTASSGLPVTLTSGTQAICTVSGFVVTLHVPGTCTLTATQPGDNVYLAATAVTRSFNVTKAAQTITLPNPGPRSLQNPSVVLSPSASSGLPVTLTSGSVNVCTVSGTTVTLLRTGTCRIRATQPGDATYAAAPTVTITFTVTP
jgi:probable HAF family extracellular repeat protein